MQSQSQSSVFGIEDRKDNYITQEDEASDDLTQENTPEELGCGDLEQPRERTVCQYYQSSGRCPYLEVGCMFLHEAAPDTEAAGAEADSEGEEERTEAAPTTLRYRERLSARSRNNKVNEDRFRKVRDLSISCP